MTEQIEFLWTHTRDLIIVVLLVLIYKQLGGAQEMIPKGPSRAAIGQRCQGAVLASIDSNDPALQVSGVTEDPERPGFAAFAQASERLMPLVHRQYPGRLIIALISSAEINAWSVPNAASDLSLVCIPSAFTDFIHDEDELAFVIAHEIGHTVNPACTKQTICETNADETGFRLLLQSGYDGYAAAGYFGRWEMYSGELQTGLVGSLHQALMDHPITPKRIENMRRLLLLETTRAAN